MKLNVKWSKLVKTVTIITSVIVVASGIVLCYFYLKDFNWVMLLPCLLLSITFGYFVIDAPLSIEINESELTLNKLMRRLSIKYSDIKEIDIYDAKKINVRLLGSGGFCGHLGLFYNKQMGKYISYVGDYKQAFYIITNENKKYLFSCKNREEVVKAIQTYKQQ